MHPFVTFPFIASESVQYRASDGQYHSATVTGYDGRTGDCLVNVAFPMGTYPKKVSPADYAKFPNILLRVGGKGKGKGHGKGHSKGSGKGYGKGDREKSRSGMPSTPRGWHGFNGQTITMYHGTKSENARQILSDGAFKQSVGGMLGRGVYLSADIEKAKAYGDGTIFTVEVKVGKVAKIDAQGHPMQKSWNSGGYNSAWVPKNCGMVPSGLSETCVFNPRRIRIISLQ